MEIGTGRKHRGVRLLLVIPAVLGVVVAFATVYYLNDIRVARRQTPGLIAAAEGRYDRAVTLAELSPERRAMLLAVEDPAFRLHHGVDLATPGAGMTTITQGLVKLLYFPDGFHPGIAKIRQTLIAQYVLDALVSKDDQLLLFLNIAYLGHEQGRAIHGCVDGARTYFDKEFRALTDEEFLSLVAMLIGPNAFKPGTPAHDERMQRIHAYLAGGYEPAGLLDVEYDGRRRGTVAEEALMVLLRLITDARP